MERQKIHGEKEKHNNYGVYICIFVHFLSIFQTQMDMKYVRLEQ